LLQSALAADHEGTRVLRANFVMLAVLVPGLLLAGWAGGLLMFAAARGLAEAARVAALLLALWRGRDQPQAQTSLVAGRPLQSS
jgi:hypothetical protein